MPFVETYSVDFRNGNVHPHLNLNGWSDMQLFPPTPDEFADRFPDPSGYIFTITRNLTVPAEVPARNNAYVVPGGLSLDLRLFMRVTFDLPRAEGFSLFDHGPLEGEFEPIEGASSAEHGRLGGEIEPPGSLSPGLGPIGGKFSVPEPWAVVLNVSPTSDLLSDWMVNLTCQFNRNPQFNGVRLNTPRVQDIGALQTDKAAPLESPLDYGIYQGGYMAFPNGTDGVVDPPVFSLEHSFCGNKAEDNKHTPGSGSLKILRTWQSEVQDHRVFSNDALISYPGQLTSIGALGVSLVTLSGYGRMSVRLRTFSIWVNDSV
jgi:hypothetical protein